MFNPNKASWGCTPYTKDLADKLSSLDNFPSQGEVEDKKNNRALEKFRKAQNVVYDCFNNGLGNRGSQCKGALGIRKRDLALPTYSSRYGHNPGNWDQVEELIEAAFTPIVLAAAKEQGLISE
jgi:hypothetical protein